MNDLSNNVYILGRQNTLAAYTLQSFLHNEIALKRPACKNDIVLAVYDVMFLHGFNVHHVGTKFLNSLVCRYVIKSDYSEQTAIAAISSAYGLDEPYIIGCIQGCIRENDKLSSIAKRTLCAKDIPQSPSIQDVVAILGALFVIYFNFTVDDERFTEDSRHSINFNTLVSKNG